MNEAFLATYLNSHCNGNSNLNSADSQAAVLIACIGQEDFHSSSFLTLSSATVVHMDRIRKILCISDSQVSSDNHRHTLGYMPSLLY